jgi:hypothetical protein
VGLQAAPSGLAEINRVLEAYADRGSIELSDPNRADATSVCVLALSRKPQVLTMTAAASRCTLLSS